MTRIPNVEKITIIFEGELEKIVYNAITKAYGEITKVIESKPSLNSTF